MVLTVLTGVAWAGSSPPAAYGLQVTRLVASPRLGGGLPPGVAYPGQVVHFNGTLTGGVPYNTNPIPGNILRQGGYHLYWFFGVYNDTTNVSRVSAVQQQLPEPATCLSSTTEKECFAVVNFENNYTYYNVGTYVVSLTVYDGSFDYVIATTEITIVPTGFSVKIKSVVQTVNPNGSAELEEGVPMQFTGSCVGTFCKGVDLQWKFGDGSIGYGPRTFHTYLERGTYVVTLTGTNASTGSINNTFYTANVYNLPPFTLKQGPVSNITGGNITYKGSFVGPIPVAYSPVGGWPYQMYLPPFNKMAPLIVYAGFPVEFCSWAYDLNPNDVSNVTFYWRFGDGGIAYTNPGPAPADAPPDICIPGPIPLVNSTTGPLPGAPVRMLAPALTSVSHVFECPGFYNVTITSFDEERVNTTSRYPLYIQAINVPNPSGHFILNYSMPVGQVALLNGNRDLMSLQGIAEYGAFYNYSWITSSTGLSYGDIGRVSSYRPVNETVTLTAQPNTVALPCCSPTPRKAQSWANFYDVRPTVGIDSFYTKVSPTVTIASSGHWCNVTCSEGTYTAVGITILENSANMSWYNFAPKVQPISPITMQMSNAWGILVKFAPKGPTGHTWVNFTFGWGGTSSNVASCAFDNSNSATWACNISLNSYAIGEPVYGQLTFFSPDQTNMTGTVDWGDSTSTSFSASAPSTIGPSSFSMPFSHTWAAGKNYILNWTACDDSKLCGYSVITVGSTTALSASDTAPIISWNTNPTAASVDQSLTFNASITRQDNASYVYPCVGKYCIPVTLLSPPNNVTWQWGDGQNSYVKPSPVTGTIQGIHVYQYSGRYAVVVYARSFRGESNAIWRFINIENAPPYASFSVNSPKAYVGEPVTFSGANSASDLWGAKGLSFGWVFGDGHFAGGQRSPAVFVTNTYKSAGTYTASLIVQNDEGQTSTSSQSITVSSTSPTAPYPTLPTTYTIADQFTWFKLNIPAGSTFSSVPLVNVSWYWGNHSSNSTYSWGLSAGHTFMLPGVYSILANVSAPGITVCSVKGSVTVNDGIPMISLPYVGGEVYGAGVTSNFTARVVGDLADKGRLWSFNWSWGDGSQYSLFTNSGNSSSQSHAYNYSSMIGLSVNVSGPFHNFGAPKGNVTANLLGVPDSDYDGLPDSYEVMVTHTNRFLADSTGPFHLVGTGCTDYVGPNCENIPGVGSFNGDADNDGLTNIQEITGSVTGFYSNPLDNNTNGDGLMDGAHFDTNSFTSQQNVVFSSGAPTYVVIPNVNYVGPRKAFNDSQLSIVVNAPANSLAYVSLSLIDPEGQSFTLSNGLSVSDPVFYLLNSTPTNGIVSKYGFTNLSVFAPQGNSWELQVTYTGSGKGAIPSATMTVSYYTDPSHADPTHQGMLQGPSLTVPVLNCTLALSDPHYLVYNPSNSVVWGDRFKPYSEDYWKLSVEQGVPYVPGNSVTLTKWNTATACNQLGSTYGIAVPSTMYTATATYLGDTDFGISPWNAHAASDPALTNGMKALGSYNYGLTAGKYMSYSGTWSRSIGWPIDNNNTAKYPADPLAGTSWGPLNPTVLSTAGDGIPDSQAVDPVAPLGLQVAIRSATDGNCYLLGSLGSGPQDIVSVTLQTPSGQAGPTIYTPATYGANPGSCDLGFGSNNYNFTFNDLYYLPLNNSQSTFTLNYNLWQDNTLTATGSRESTTVTGSLNSKTIGKYFNTSSSNIWASVQVEPLTRLNTIVVNNTTGEIQNLPGYGWRYSGEQKFDAFDINISNSAAAPFVNGVNVILENRADLADSSVNATLLTNPASLGGLGGAGGPCEGPLGNAVVTSQSQSAASNAAVVTTWSVNASSSLCPALLLSALAPFNASKVAHGGEYIVLNTTQLELLGLNSQVLELAPFLAPSLFNSPSGGPPTNLLSTIVSIALNAWNAVQGSVVAFANFMATLPHIVASVFCQVLLGVLAGIASAVQAAVQMVVTALETLESIIINLARTLFQTLIAPIIAAFTQWAKNLEALFQPIVTGSAGSQLLQAVEQFWSSFTGPLFITLFAISTGIMVIYTIIEGFSLGAASLLGVVLGVFVAAAATTVVSLGSTVLAGIQQGGLAAVDAIESFVNLTAGYAPIKPTGSAMPACEKNQWDGVATSVSMLDDAAGVVLGPVELLTAMLDPKAGPLEIVETVALLVLALLALDMDYVSITIESHDPADAIFLSVLSDVIAIFGFVDWMTDPEEDDPALEPMAAIAGQLDGIAALVGTSQLISEAGSLSC
jgi:PKD repeat protein